MWTEPLMTAQIIRQDTICYHWFKQQLIVSVSKPSISQRQFMCRSQLSKITCGSLFCRKVFRFCVCHCRWTRSGSTVFMLLGCLATLSGRRGRDMPRRSVSSRLNSCYICCITSTVLSDAVQDYGCPETSFSAVQNACTVRLNNMQ